jgi:hypothetical protein
MAVKRDKSSKSQCWLTLRAAVALMFDLCASHSGQLDKSPLTELGVSTFFRENDFKRVVGNFPTT